MNEGDDKRLEADAAALSSAIGELTRTLAAIDLAAQRHDEAAVVNAIALAGRGLGWPDAPAATSPTVRQLWQQLDRLTVALESFTRLTMPVWASHGELALAGEVQQRLMPPPELSVPGATIHAWWQPAGSCGGDWWLAHPLDEQRGLVVLGDVTGHGAPAALIAGVIRGACDLARMGMRARLQPSQLLRMLNRVVVESSGHDFMSTSIALTTEQAGSTLHLANAGHRAPLLLSQGEWRLVQGDREPPLGSELAVSYAQLAVPVAPGDRLVVFTDGVPEAENTQGHQLGEKAIRQICEQSTSDATGAPLRDRLEQLVTEHGRPLRPRDDVTVLVIDIG